MLPLRDINPRRTTPVVNVLLIIANIWMFFWEVSLGPNIEPALAQVAFIPARFWTYGPSLAELIRIFWSMFLHGGWLHLGGNMLYLWIFGDNVEDRLGHFKYILFYLLCGLIATFTHAFFNPNSRMPSIGASGAIAGVLGAYLLMFPKARVVTLIPIIIFFTIREIPAVIVLGLWFVLQLFVGVESLGIPEAQNAGGVAYFAHIGGFAAGMLLAAVMGGLRARPAYP